MKDSFETYNFDSVSKISDDISKLLSMSKYFKPILIHGAGSFGHFQAKQYSVSSGARYDTGRPTSPDERISSFLREGFSKTRLSVTKLNHHIITTMIQKGIPCVGVSPFPTISTHNRELQDKGLIGLGFHKAVGDVLDLGLVPILHGDACIDTGDRQVSILSGDTLFVNLCEIFLPDYGVFLADVEGVLTAPPGSVPEPQVITRIFIDEEGSISMSVDGERVGDIDMTQATHDVTGGIRHKLNAALEVARKVRIPVYIVKAGSEDALQALQGKIPPGGTSVMFRSSAKLAALVME
jgi:isopentenyl phosphate kinase